MFIGAPHIHHQQIGRGVDQGPQLLGRQHRRGAGLSQQLPEGLAGDIDIDEQLQPGLAPAQQTALQGCHIGVTKRLQPPPCRFHQAFAERSATVEQHHRPIAPRQAPGGIELQPTGAELGGPERMALGVGGLLAQIDQGDLPALTQGCMHLLRADQGQGTHGVGACQRLGNQALL